MLNLSGMDLAVEDIFVGNQANPSSLQHTSTILAPLHGNGLNLSTNHGLDLTCPNYEGLNLSLTHENHVFPQQHQQQQPQPQQPNCRQKPQALQGLNLTAPNTNNFLQNTCRIPNLVRNCHQAATHSEVGLNLGVQSAGMNLTGGDSGSGQGSTFQQQQHYYYNTHISGGYINLSTQKVASYNNNSNSTSHPTQSSTTAVSKNSNLFETQQRHSPLNLEQHRSSPLNLTAVHNSSNGQNSQRQTTQQYFNQQHADNHNQQHSLQHDNFGYQNNENFNMYQHDHQQVYHHQQQQQHDSNNMFCPNTNNSSQEMVNFQYSSCNQQQQDSSTSLHNRIRLFCSSCCQEFGSTTELNKHMERHNSGHDVAMSNEHQNWNSVDHFQSAETNFTEAPYILNNNDATESSANVKETATNVENVIPHTNNSTNKTDEPTQSCNECSMTFATGQDLKKHLDLAHNGRSDASFQCRFCAKHFTDKVELKTHLEGHAKDKPFQCEFCDVRLTNQAGLNRHIKRIHDKIQNHECSDCGKRYYEKHDLQRHRQSHEKMSQVPDCDVCKKSFTSNYQREKHKCKGPEGKFPCDLCDKKLQNKATWGFHMWKHTKDAKYIEVDVDIDTKEKESNPA